MAGIGGELIPMRDLAPVGSVGRTLFDQSAQCQLRGTMALLRGAPIQPLRLGIVTLDTQAAPQSYAQVVLRIQIPLRRRAPE